MRWIAALTAGMLALASAAGASAAVRSAQVEAVVSGSLVISFHGDPAAGCQARRVCAYQGQIIWRPEQAMGGVLGFHQGQAELIVFGDTQDSPAGSGVFTRVQRQTSSGRTASCVDAVTNDVTTPLFVHAGEISLQVPGVDTQGFATRCAGPAPADIASAIPLARLPLTEALKGHRQFDLQATREFAGGGFAGTVRSTLVIHLGAPLSSGGSSATKVRIVTEQLTETAASGTVNEQFAGSPATQGCGLLDSCGLQGSLTLQPAQHSSIGMIEALGAVHRPIRDFLTALGLSTHGRTAGIYVYGELYWTRLGNLASVEQQNNVTCTDTQPGGQAALLMLSSGGRLSAQYAPINPLRDRCPGPTPPFDQTPLAATTIPRRTIAAHTFTLTLRATRPFTDDGYLGQLNGTIHLAIARGNPIARIAPTPQD